MNEPTRRPRLSPGLCLGDGLGSVGTGIYTTVPGLLLLFYMTDTLGIPAWLAGLGIFVPKLWDVITDPWMGSLSDRSQTRWGRRRPWLLAGGLSLPVLFALLFMTPDFAEPWLRFAWVLGFYMLCATTYTIFSVPYIAMPTEMTDDPDEVTTLMAWRMALLTVGVLVSGALAPISMLPDVIAADREASGIQREGAFTGLWMAIDKGALAFGALLTSLVLELAGFIESGAGGEISAGELATQPASALVGIRVGTALLPAGFVLLSLPIIRRYKLGRL